jgi:uncharacterized protein YxjI
MNPAIYEQPVLVVSQKAKLVEITNQYTVSDANGQVVGYVQQVGQSAARKVLRFVSNVDQFLSHKFEITDAQGGVLLQITRPAKLIKSTVIVADAAGQELGRLIQQNAIGKIRFGLHDATGQQLAELRAENWRAWNFSIVDADGQELARVDKKWEGLAKAMFTTADNYAVAIHQRLADPLRALVIAAALTIDTALKQDEG